MFPSYLVHDTPYTIFETVCYQNSDINLGEYFHSIFNRLHLHTPGWVRQLYRQFSRKLFFLHIELLDALFH